MIKKTVLALLILFMAASVSATTMSVSDIEYESNHEFFDGELIAIEMVADESTESLHATVDANTLSQAIEGETTQDIEIEIIENDRKVEYGLEESPNKRDVREGIAIHQTGFESQDAVADWAASNCVGGSYAYKQTQYWFVEYDGWCIADQGKVGTVGEFREDSTSPRSQFEVTYQLNVDGEPSDTVTLSNSDVGEGVQANLGSNAKVEWLGNYDLSTSPEGTSSGALALHSNSFGGNWRVISEDAYDNYNGYIRYNLEGDLVDWAEGRLSEDELQSRYDQHKNMASSPYSSHELSTARTVDGSLSSGLLEYTPDSHLFHPSFMIYIDAGEDGYLTIERPAGVPDIIGVEGDRVGEFESGNIQVNAMNTGDHEGEFSARIGSCSTEFDYDDSPKYRNIDGGDSHVFDLSVSFSSGSYDTTEIEGSCDVELTEVTTGETVSSSVEVVGVQEEECSEGERNPTVHNGDEAIAECTDGLNQEIVEVCTENSEGENLVAGFEEGEWTCILESEGSGESSLLEAALDPFKSAYDDVTDVMDEGYSTVERMNMLLNILVVFTVAAFTFGLSYNKLFNITGLQAVKGVKENILRLLFATVLTGVSVLLVYEAFSSITAKVLVLLAVLAASYLYIMFGKPVNDVVRTLT